MAGTLTVDTLKASTGVLATQNGMSGICKAWVNFNGSTAVIANSFNVSSVTRSSTGNYTINFTTAMANSNLCGVGGAGVNGVSYGAVTQYSFTTTTCNIATMNWSGNANTDYVYTGVAIFGS